MLTEKQQDFFAYLQRRLRDEGQLPSLRQAAKELAISHNAVAQLLAQLEKKDWLPGKGATAGHCVCCRKIPGRSVRWDGNCR
ncbi:MAG: hypothetical protein P8X86_08805 [Desulfofustis sp.]